MSSANPNEPAGISDNIFPDSTSFIRVTLLCFLNSSTLSADTPNTLSAVAGVVVVGVGVGIDDGSRSNRKNLRTSGTTKTAAMSASAPMTSVQPAIFSPRFHLGVGLSETFPRNIFRRVCVKAAQYLFRYPLHLRGHEIRGAHCPTVV